MRAVDKGAAPQHYSNYTDAKPDLFDRIGPILCVLRNAYPRLGLCRPCTPVSKRRTAPRLGKPCAQLLFLQPRKVG